jgi:hypothetical protein
MSGPPRSRVLQAAEPGKMMMLVHDFTATPSLSTTVRLGGRPFVVSPLDPRSLRGLREWIKVNRPHPFAALRKQKAMILRTLGGREYKTLLAAASRAAASWPPSPGEWDGQRALLAEEDGGAELIRVALGQAGAAVTTEEAASIARAATAEEVALLLEVLFGLGPGWVPGPIRSH